MLLSLLVPVFAGPCEERPECTTVPQVVDLSSSLQEDCLRFVEESSWSQAKMACKLAFEEAPEVVELKLAYGLALLETGDEAGKKLLEEAWEAGSRDCGIPKMLCPPEPDPQHRDPVPVDLDPKSVEG